MKILILVPSYNSTDYNTLIKKINNVTNKDVLIIDDGSKTPITLDRNIKNTTIIYNITNKGKGYSIRKGAKYALENGYTHIVTIDSDLQHHPKYLNLFLSKVSQYKLVYGKRK